jgi:hypothetical protein
VIAFSSEEAVDVSRRYTVDYSKMLQRRTQVSEEWLASCIEAINATRQRTFSLQRRKYLLAQADKERQALVAGNSASSSSKSAESAAAELLGRISGSKEWKESRGETGTSSSSSSTSGGASAELELTRIYGGSHGDSAPFNDLKVLTGIAAAGPLRISKVTGWSSTFVNGLQFHYTLPNGQVVAGGEHYGAHDSPAVSMLELDLDDQVVAIRGRAGAIIDHLEVVTRKGKQLSLGSSAGGTAFQLEAPPGKMIVGFFGAKGGHMHNVGLVLAPQPPS